MLSPAIVGGADDPPKSARQIREEEMSVRMLDGLHVFIGVVWALGVLFAAGRNWFSKQKYQGVEIFGLYWHFVDVVWIILFMLIYLL